jgi:hypothetical protein
MLLFGAYWLQTLCIIHSQKMDMLGVTLTEFPHFYIFKETGKMGMGGVGVL